MKLSRLYSDQPALFVPINFHEGLNVILANIQRSKDPSALGHNLGKSLLIDIIDFGLLKEVKKEHFFKSRSDLFASLVFFLEIQLPPGGYLTIRRSAAEPTKIAFKHHQPRHQDFTLLPQEQWDHWRESFDNAVKLLDSYLAFTSIKPWSYRKGVSYFLRTQQDYFDVFKLAKFVGTHKQWKPYLARVLGFDDQLLTAKYEAAADCEKHTAEQKELQAELTLKPSDFEKLRASIALKRDEVAGKLRSLDAFDFLGQETAMARELAESIETEIASNNELIYNARHDLAQIERSLGDEIHFDLADVQRVFQEAQITFPTQLARDYEDLVEFNRRILTERSASLSEHAAALRKQLGSTRKPTPPFRPSAATSCKSSVVLTASRSSRTYNASLIKTAPTSPSWRSKRANSKDFALCLKSYARPKPKQSVTPPPFNKCSTLAMLDSRESSSPLAASSAKYCTAPPCST